MRARRPCEDLVETRLSPGHRLRTRSAKRTATRSRPRGPVSRTRNLFRGVVGAVIALRHHDRPLLSVRPVWRGLPSRGRACIGGCTHAVEVSDIFVAILVVIRGCEPRHRHAVRSRPSSIGGSSTAPGLVRMTTISLAGEHVRHSCNRRGRVLVRDRVAAEDGQDDDREDDERSRGRARDDLDEAESGRRFSRRSRRCGRWWCGRGVPRGSGG